MCCKALQSKKGDTSTMIKIKNLITTKYYEVISSIEVIEFILNL